MSVDDDEWFQSQFDSLRANDRESLLKLLGCIRDHPDPYYLKQIVGPSNKRPYTWLVVFPYSEIREPCEQHHFENDVLAFPGMTVAKLDVYRGFDLGQGVLEWFRRAYPPSDEQVRQWIAEELLEKYLALGGALTSHFHISPEELVRRFGITRQQFNRQAALLKASGMVRMTGHSENLLEDGYIRLTDTGLQWAAGGFSRTDVDLVPRVEVTVNLSTTVRVVNEISLAEVDQNTKNEFVDALTDLKDDPTSERFARVLGIAANVKELVPPLVKFLNDNSAWLSSHFLR